MKQRIARIVKAQVIRLRKLCITCYRTTCTCLLKPIATDATCRRGICLRWKISKMFKRFIRLILKEMHDKERDVEQYQKELKEKWHDDDGLTMRVPISCGCGRYGSFKNG